MRILWIGVLAASTAVAVSARQETSPSHHQAEVNKRGAQVMGFAQDATIHHFFLYEDGGAIEVSVRDAGDKGSLDAIRGHLPQIALMFGRGQFDAPMHVHDTKVPGTAEMARLKARLTYKFVETSNGGRVNIVATDPEAVAAVHQFLKFQIVDHVTGDSTSVRKR